MRVMSADEWERELAQKIAEEKQTEADWKLLTKAQQFEKTNIKKAIEKKRIIKMKFVFCRPL